MNIEIISGSARKESLTVRAAYAVQNWLKENTSHHIGLIDCRQFRLPALQRVFNSIDNTPEAFKWLTERILGADAFIWVTPEYNGSYAPALKNLVDHFPKQLHKPVGIVAASNGNFGGMRAAQQLILLSAGIFTITSPQLLIIPAADKKFDENGELTDKGFYQNIHNFITEFLWLAEKLAP